MLDSYPEIEVSVSPELAGPFSFTKTELSQLLGGSTQGLFVRVTKSARPLAVKYDISEYLCPNLNQNSWLPTKPGAHGYMQVGLGDRDRARFNEPEIHPVFVGAESQFRYFGTYELTRVERLTVGEWLTLPEKYEYSETTKDKEKEQRGRNVDDILEDYRSGKLRAPCVLLKCIGFDMDFYRDFVDASRTYSAAFGTVTTVSSQAPSASPAPTAKKGRKRTAGNRFHMEGAEGGVEGEQEVGSSPKRRRMSKAPAANAPARTSMRRSGRLSTKLPAAGSGRTVNEDDDGDGVSSGSGTEFNGDDD
ncbi:hypothetical protein DAEQUDRAFT_24500 [Daedalea quercina L-15889]|uniref:DUF6697 domain-containing protein n=1 Tax=Daedalea quercina L-15889 TaxID=1314783 RepID=A0A165UNF8_9APHY|nr:hypothetical protein DAEQUDRAFT_24500 [Daedalea quercina L-15889]